jgi:MFS family permease
MGGEMRNRMSGLKQRMDSQGMRTFVVIWFGQLVSIIGSGLTAFALGIWVYQRTGSVTKFALIALCASLPNIVMLPLAGALVDRWDRRRTLILSNVGAGLSTLCIALLLFTGGVGIAHIYVGMVAISIFSAFQTPAFSATITLLISKNHYGRASGMWQSAQAASRIVAPLLAGLLVTVFEIKGLLLLDFGTYVVAVITLLVVRLPSLKAAGEGEADKGSLWKEATYGWTFIRERPGLLVLMFYFAIISFIMSVTQVLFTPLVLSVASVEVLGVLLSVSGIGFLLGGILMSIWGGPQRRVPGVLGFGLLLGLSIALVGLRPSVYLMACGAFLIYFVVPIINGCNQVIWQNKTAPEIQGRVFAMRQMIGWSLMPLAYIVAGPLADKVFGPLMSDGGALAGSFGWLVGEGGGRGIRLLFIVAGLIAALIPAGAYLYPHLRLVEHELPDTTVDEVLVRV